MSDAFAVDFSDPAKKDIGRLFALLMLRATTADELERVQVTFDELRLAIEVQLGRAPFNAWCLTYAISAKMSPTERPHSALLIAGVNPTRAGH